MQTYFAVAAHHDGLPTLPAILGKQGPEPEAVPA